MNKMKNPEPESFENTANFLKLGSVNKTSKTETPNTLGAGVYINGIISEKSI